jgi:hypothetical protein
MSTKMKRYMLRIGVLILHKGKRPSTDLSLPGRPPPAGRHPSTLLGCLAKSEEKETGPSRQTSRAKSEPGSAPIPPEGPLLF